MQYEPACSVFLERLCSLAHKCLNCGRRRTARLPKLAVLEECQAARQLPNVPGVQLAGLIFATAHGLIAIEASGKMLPEKKLTGVGSGLELMVRLLSPGDQYR
jgi:hypothetical protein